MSSRRVRLHVDTDSTRFAEPTPSGSLDAPATPTSIGHRGGPRESTFRTVQLELRIYSPSVKVYRLQGQTPTRSVPVFGDHDQIRGRIALDPRSCSKPGRLTLTLEGAFLFSRQNLDHNIRSGKQKHVFFNSSQVYHTSEPHSASTPISALSIREAFANTVRPLRIRRSPTSPLDFETVPQSFQFKFELPHPVREGQEIPPSFSVSSIVKDGNQSKTHREQAEVSYIISALWEADDDRDTALLEAPIVFQPDTGFHSLDGLSLERRSWLELPLRVDRSNMPIHCAITLPNPASCSRSGAIPYFVVFTTHPRSLAVCREIAADATIAVSLLRIVTINISRPFTVVSRCTSAPFPAGTKGPQFVWNAPCQECDSPTHSSSSTSRLLKRVVKNAPPGLARASSRDDIGKKLSSKDPPYCPSAPVSETRVLQTDMSIGFPKRPRNPCIPGGHSSLDAHVSLPDGLYKGQMQLNANMLPSIDWAGLNVKYYLDVSVLFGQDELRARVPVHIF